MWWGYHGFHPFGWFFLLLLAVFLVFRFFAFRRCGRWHHGWHDGRLDAEAILRRRLASGEISEAEYKQLQEILAK